MSTLFLRLAGPMQSWGTQSRFTVRDTGLEPSKSGVIGLLCAALGRPRSDPLDDLVDLRMGVRVDREGIMRMDFQTAGGAHRIGEDYGVPTADGTSKRTVTSQRYYLADADFLVGLEGDERLLKKLDRALASPKWPLYLGRKSYVPSSPIHIRFRPSNFPGSSGVPGLTYLPLREALKGYPKITHSKKEKEKILREIERQTRAGPPIRLRLVLDTPLGTTPDVRSDVPISFSSRQFTIRNVVTDWVDLKPKMIQEV